MKKKVVSLLAAMALAVTALAGCGSNDAATTGTDAATVAATTEAAGTTEATGTTEAATDSEAVTGVKAGFIFLHDENSTYDLNFLNAAKAACEKLGIEYMTKTNIPEGQEAYEAACELADAGCNFIFADSLDMRTTSSRLLRSIPMFSSAMQPEPRLIPRAWTTSTMHLLPSMMAVILQVSLQV